MYRLCTRRLMILLESFATHLHAGADQGERVGHELRDAAGQHPGGEHGGRRGPAVVLLQQPLLQQLEGGDVHARVGDDADLRGP